jgi:predicted TIM-barrel fold metal-dependent hydrolase
MPTIDSDAHVVENEQTWAYMDPGDRQFRPVAVRPPGSTRLFWFIDGKTRGLPTPVPNDADFAEISKNAGRVMNTPQETREMRDVNARVRHMDELGIDVQVLYPTIFIEQVADRPEVDVALCRAYNRWLVDIWKQGNGRLRWACVLPLLSMNDAFEQLEFARNNGACAIYMRGIEGQRLIHDHYFHPLFERAQDLDIAIGVHIAIANPMVADLLSQEPVAGGAFWKFRLTSVGAFHSLVMNGLPEVFPKLRIGFLEASAQWLPYVLKDVRRRAAARGRSLPDNLLEAYRLYVSCQTDDDIAYVAGYAGEKNLVIGTDYGHNDQSTEIEALRNLGQSGQISASLYKNITDDNARALYGL